MLNQIKVNCKNYSEHILNGFHGGQSSKGEFRCSNPDCRCDVFYRHGTYERHILHFEADPVLGPEDTIPFELPDGTLCVDTKMTILRVQCAGCGITHGIAAADMIPFHVFSLFAFLTVILYQLADASEIKSGHLVIHPVDGLSWHVQKLMFHIYQEYRARMMAALRMQGLYAEAADLTDIALVKVYLDISPPCGAVPAFLRCHKQPVFVSRRSTVSYPLRFLIPQSL